MEIKIPQLFCMDHNLKPLPRLEKPLLVTTVTTEALEDTVELDSIATV